MSDSSGSTSIDAMHDPNLFRPFFRDLGTWGTWTAILSAIFGLPLTADEVAIYTRHTGRQNPPTRQFAEVVIEAGRRAGKSLIAAMIAVYLSCFRSYEDVLAPGERGVVMLIACDQAQAKVLMRYVAAFIEAVPMLSRLIERKTTETIDLSNKISIEARTSSFRTVRGRTVVCCVCDEIAFWRDESSANPDVEVVGAIRPGMASVPHPLLIFISTLYRRTGLLWEMDRKYFGVEDEDVLVIRGDSLSFNPTLPPGVIARAFEEDEAAAWSEYGRDGDIRFRSDIEAFVPREVVEACVVPGRYELPPLPGVQYSGFCDPSGGSSDSMTLTVGHTENGVAILDLVRERRPPFSPAVVTREFSETLRTYRCNSVVGDKYGAAWVAEEFQKNGIRYEAASRTKSELYIELLPALNSGKVQLLDDQKLITQFCRLERRTSRAGRDAVDHGQGSFSHDDVANSVAGVLVMLQQQRAVPGFAFVGDARPSTMDAWVNAKDVR